MSKIYSQRLLFTLIILFFLIFLILPITVLLGRSIVADGQLSLNYYYKVLSDNTIMKSLFNSMKISLLAATTTTVLAFFVAYTIHMTHSPKWIKSYNKTLVILPMLVPTITYGFILMYLFGNEGI